MQAVRLKVLPQAIPPKTVHKFSDLKLRHPGGRPTKRTPEIIERIAEAISYGLTDEEAAALVGIDDLTLTRWRKIPEFCRAIKGATATRKLARLKRIEAGEPGWQGAAWSVERQDPERFARPEVQLNQKISVEKQDNFTVWLQQQAPKEKAAKEVDIEDLEIICDAETEYQESLPYTSTTALSNIESMDLVRDMDSEPRRAIEDSYRSIREIEPRGVGLAILAAHANRQQRARS